MNERSRKGKWHKRAAQGPRALRSVALSEHAKQRMSGRRINEDALSAVLCYGRHVRAQGASHWQIGWREVRDFQRQGIDLSPYEGVNVVCTPDDETVKTVLRNREGRKLRRGAGRPNRGRWHKR